MEKEQVSRQDVLELASRCIADINVLDTDDWVARYLAPDFVWETSPMALGVRTETREEFRSFYDDWTGAYAGWFLEIEDIVALDGNTVVAAMRQGGRPHGSDQVVDLRYGSVSVWRDGLCVATTNYTTFEEALAAGEHLLESDG